MRSAWPITFDAKDSKSGETKEFEKRKASILINAEENFEPENEPICEF